MCGGCKEEKRIEIFMENGVAYGFAWVDDEGGR